MKTISRIKQYVASPEEVFDCLDDLGVTGMHMTTSSMPMMGGKLNLQFLSPNKTGFNTRYRWTGKVLWISMDFTVVVTRWERGKEKTWETENGAKMIIMSWFRMDLRIDTYGQETIANLSIQYEPPKEWFNRILCFMLADWYCRWCLKNMLNDTESKLQHAGSIEIETVKREIH